mgnify:CR=1 FL=1
MKVSSLRPVDIQTIQRVVLSQIEMAAHLPMDEELHVYTSFPAHGSGPIVVDMSSALHDSASVEAEVAGDDELYIFCGNSLTDLANLIDTLPSSIAVDGVASVGETRAYRVISGASVQNDSSEVILQLIRNIPPAPKEPSTLNGSQKPKRGGIRSTFYDAGIRLVKPVKDYLPSGVIVVLYRIAHLIRGN